MRSGFLDIYPDRHIQICLPLNQLLGAWLGETSEVYSALMIEKTTPAGRLLLRLPSYAAIVGLVIVAPIAFCESDRFVFLSVFVVAPILIVISLIFVVWVIRKAVDNSARERLAILGTLTALWAIPISLFLYNREHPFELRETARWLASSQDYKNEVLAQPTSAKGELKHIEWDTSGFAGVANNTVYLVFDPADALSTAAKSRQPGKFNGIPCEVPLVRRLESQWYAVLFYTDEYWGQGECK